MTVVDPEALTLLESITVNDSVYVPLTDSVMLNDPVPEYGEVPPVAETSQLNGLPAVTAESQVTVTTRGCGAIVTVMVPRAVTPLESVTKIGTVYGPFDGAMKLVPELVYGAVPPVAE